MDCVEEALGCLDESLGILVPPLMVVHITGMRVLAEVHAAVPHMPEHLLECHVLLLHGVTTVIEKDIEERVTGLELMPECWVSLVADGNLDSWALKLLSCRVDVDAIVAVVEATAEDKRVGLS
jgi:hypothetical protein